MTKNSEISLYVDALVVEAILSNHLIEKKAQGGGFEGIVESIKNYVLAHIDPDKKTESVLNMLAPGAIFMVFRAMGLTGVGGLLALAASVFHIDVGGALNSIYEYVKEVVSGGKKVTSAEVNSKVSESVDAASGTPSIEEAMSAYQQLHAQASSSDLNKFKVFSSYSKSHKKSVAMQIRQAKMIKLVIADYESNFYKQAQKPGIMDRIKNLFSDPKNKDYLKNYSDTKLGVGGVLKKVLGFFVGVVLASAGFIVAGDLINAVLGRASPFTGTMEKGKPIPGSGTADAPRLAPVIPKSTQTKFKLNPAYSEENFSERDRWRESYTSNRHGIEDMVIDFANDVYLGLEGKDDIIASCQGFNAAVDIILYNNKDHIGHGIVLVPTYAYHSKKQIVDSFIDEVAKRA